MESAGQDIVVEKQESKWEREYDLRWSKAGFLFSMFFGISCLWNVWRYVPDFNDKLGFAPLILIPAFLGEAVWKAEKRGEIKKQMAASFLMMLGLLTVFASGTVGKIVHDARAISATTQILK